MSKQVDAKNQIWYEQDGKYVRMGLTRSFLDTLDECWHILPSNMTAIKMKAPLLTIESNDGLISLLSPVTGNLSNWDSKAANFPEKLTEEDVIVTLSSEAVEDPRGPTDAERAAARNRLEAAGIVQHTTQLRVFEPFSSDDPVLQTALDRLRRSQDAVTTRRGVTNGAVASGGVTGHVVRTWNELRFDAPTVTQAPPRASQRPRAVPRVVGLPNDWLAMPVDDDFDVPAQP